MKHAQEHQDARGRISGVSISADQDVQRVEIRLGNLVKHLEGILETGEWGKGSGSDELAGRVGVEEEGRPQHMCLYLLQLFQARALGCE